MDGGQRSFLDTSLAQESRHEPTGGGLSAASAHGDLRQGTLWPARSVWRQLASLRERGSGYAPRGAQEHSGFVSSASSASRDKIAAVPSSALTNAQVSLAYSKPD